MLEGCHCYGGEAVHQTVHWSGAGFSEEFEKGFLELLKRSHPFSRVAAKVVYNDYIANPCPPPPPPKHPPHPSSQTPTPALLLRRQGCMRVVCMLTVAAFVSNSQSKLLPENTSRKPQKPRRQAPTACHQ